MIFALALLTSLTAAPLLPKPRPYDALGYQLEVRLEADGTFKNRLTARLKALKPLKEIEFDAYDLAIEFALVDRVAATPSPRYDPVGKTGVLSIKPTKPIAVGQETTVEIAYSGRASSSEEGFFVKPGEGQALPSYFTQFEPTYAQRFFPCNDVPTDKATFELTAVVDERYTVISNGRKTQDEKFSEGAKNLRRVTWVQEKANAPYLVALAIGEYEPVIASAEIPATIWVRPGTKDRAFAAVDALKPLYNFMVGATGTPYPWAKLDVVAVPHSGISGMENTSVIFERESKVVVDHLNDQPGRMVITGLLAHEMAHQWFGNWVTCAWWNDAWLNEGFATYLGGEAADAYDDNDAHEVARVEAVVDKYFREENGPHSHPLAPTSTTTAESLFDATTYLKGASVVSMLEQWVGKAEFKNVLKAYLEKFGQSTATSADFFKLAGQVSHQEKAINAFKDAWLSKKGYPVLFPQTSLSGNRLTVTLRQRPNRSDEKGPFIFKLPIVVHRLSEPAYTKEQVIVVDKPEVTVSFDVMAAPEWIDWNQGFKALTQVNASSVSEAQWALAALHDPDPTWRLLAVWSLMGELGNPHMKQETKPTVVAMSIILNVLTHDPSPYVRVAVLNRLLTTRFKQLPPEFSAPILGLAKKPSHLNGDAIGTILVRRTAMKLLGRTDSTEGHEYVLDALGKKDIDINYLEGLAQGAAFLGTSSALATLRTALITQKGRGYPYYRRTAQALGVVASAEVVDSLRQVLSVPDNELSQGLAYNLDDNPRLKSTAEFARFVRDIVLDEHGLCLEARLQYLGLLDDVKNDWAKEVLMTIADKSTSAQIQVTAKKTLDGNFPLETAKKK